MDKEIEEIDNYNYNQINTLMYRIENCLRNHYLSRVMFKCRDFQETIEKYIKLKSYKNRYFKNYDTSVIKDINYESVYELFKLCKTGNINVYCGVYKLFDNYNIEYEYINYFIAINKQTQKIELCILFLNPDVYKKTINNLNIVKMLMKTLDINNRYIDVLNSYIKLFNSAHSTFMRGGGMSTLNEITIKNIKYLVKNEEILLINLCMNLEILTEISENSIKLDIRPDNDEHFLKLSKTNMFKFNFKKMNPIDDYINKLNIEYIKQI